MPALPDDAPAGLTSYGDASSRAFSRAIAPVAAVLAAVAVAAAVVAARDRVRDRDPRRRSGTPPTLGSDADALVGRAAIHAVRVRPGQDLVEALSAVVKERGLEAACVVTCVGSLAGAKLRLALAQPGNPGTPLTCLGAHEIVSLVGTLGPDGWHLHASLSDAHGHVFGGHLLSGAVHTTAEVVLCDAVGLAFRRAFDPETGFRELRVERGSRGA